MKRNKGFLRYLFLFLLMGTSLTPVFSDPILANLNLQSGNWSVVGIPIHNFQMLPVQKELGTFVLEDGDFIKHIQKTWNLKMTFRDKCDYHYELKFYRNGDLKRTLKVNLVCGTLYDEGISYTFSPQMFEEVRAAAKPVDWSRITFNDLELLRKAIRVLDRTPGVYWYKDVQPYRYTGYFMIRVVGIPWKEPLDKVFDNVRNMVQERVGSDDFHMKEFLTTVSQGKRVAKYQIYCEQPLADGYGSGQYIRWRPHFFEQDSVQIVAIGVDIDRYISLMKAEKDTPSRNKR